MASTDLFLWNSFKSGNHSSFEEIYKQEFDFLFHYGKSITQDVDSISDCIQELFIELWNRKETITSTDNIRSYLVVAFRRKLIKQISDTKVEFEEKHIKDHDVSLESTLINAEYNEEQKRLLHQSIDSLTSKQKEIINLKFFQDLDYEDIAQIMEINYQSCRNLLSGAIKKLENTFKNNLKN